MATEANIKAAKELVKLYNSMTIEKIDNCGIGFDDHLRIKKELTGFGDTKTCTLCISVNKTFLNETCFDCIYGKSYNCHKRDFKESYKAIGIAKDSQSLLKAYKERAKVISKLLKLIK